MCSWHHFCFRFVLPKSARPEWWIDLFVLDTIVTNILSQHEADFQLWRIHRRAANDALGHELRLSCYTTRDVADRIHCEIQTHESLRMLQENNQLHEYRHDQRDGGIDLIADQVWPPELRTSWPFFIMGASKMVINLIQELKKSANLPEGSTTEFNATRDRYIALHTETTELWRQWGSHSLLHHINALFAYEPLIAQGWRVSSVLVSF